MNSPLCVCFLCPLLVCVACDKKPATESAVTTSPAAASPPSKPASSDAASWQYWDAFCKAAVEGEGGEILQGGVAQPNATDEDYALAFRDIAKVEQERCRKIAVLPLLHVDPDLTGYATRFVEQRLEAAGLLEDFANAIDRERQIMSGSNLAGGFVLNLFAHMNDDEGMFWNALKDQASGTASQLQEMRPLIEGLVKRAEPLSKKGTALKSEEMRVRAALAQKFGREYPSKQTYSAAKPPAVAPPLTEGQLMQTLIGQRLESAGWSFDSPSEFVSFKLLRTQKLGDGQTAYEVRTHVRGAISGQEHDFHMLLTYQRVLTRLKLIQIQQLQ